VNRTIFVTGTDTGVGKTVLTALLTRRLRAHGRPTLAVKPFCSGGREDAEALSAAQDGEVPLAAINPWSFRAPLTPLLAARRAGQSISQTEALDFLRQARRQCEVLLVEGAGGLLSPLGEGYSLRELIRGLRGEAIVVCPNRLGAINQVRLVVASLPPGAQKNARIALMATAQPDHSAASNLRLLAEFFGPERVHSVPWLRDVAPPTITPHLGHRLDSLLRPQ
jgi:dethiobiotin synthetase